MNVLSFSVLARLDFIFERTNMELIGFLAAIIVFLAPIGIYPLFYLLVRRHARRTREGMAPPVPIVSPFDGTIQPMPKLESGETHDPGVRGF
jgi:hypothetical protein